MSEKCGIVHKLGSQACNREKGHDGLCRSKAEARSGGSLMYSEWESRDGEFYRHVGYQSIYPANSGETVEEIAERISSVPPPDDGQEPQEPCKP